VTRTKLNPDQLPLIVPDSDWTVPKELPDLTRVGEIGLDTENKDDGLAQGRGPGWVTRSGYVCGAGVAWRTGTKIQKIYVPVRHPETDNFPKDNVARWIQDITRTNRVIMMNAPYDIGWLNADMGVPIPPKIEDVGCMAVMLDESRRPIRDFPKPYSLEAICHWLGVQGKDESLLMEAGNVYGFKPTEVKANMWRMPARYVGPYGEQDPVSTMECFDRMLPRIQEDGVEAAYRLEMDLIPMVHAMRARGIRLDIPRAEKFRDKMLERRDTALERIRSNLGGRVLTMNDIREQRWLVNAFSNEGVEYVEKEGKASFEKDWMRQGYVGRYEKGRQGHWLPLLIAEAKQCNDAAEKFVQGFLLDYAHNGRIHASINQFKSEDGGTRTMRFSYSDPPLQQMPTRGEQFIHEWTLTGEIGSEIRSLFLPERGEKWFSPDYSQQEYRLIVHYASVLGCEKAEEAVAKYVNDPKTSFHKLVQEMTALPYQKAKDTNFAKSYGAGKKKFASMIGSSVEEASEIMDQYDGEMPFVKQLMQRCTKAADKRGYIVMLDGARMHFNYWEAAWLSNEERQRGWREGWEMGECDLETARSRVSGQSPRPYRAGPDSQHPWVGKRLKRAFTHKAGNGLIQGGAARMGKIAMRDMFREGYVPLLQMHDEFPNSIGKEKDGKRIAQIMREAFSARVPFLVDEEYGENWGDAKHSWKESKAAR
jgi:DNA polymerase I-like protein with 3'-5' exonuclease and polymerase domains